MVEIGLGDGERLDPKRGRVQDLEPAGVGETLRVDQEPLGDDADVAERERGAVAALELTDRRGTRLHAHAVYLTDDKGLCACGLQRAACGLGA